MTDVHTPTDTHNALQVGPALLAAPTAEGPLTGTSTVVKDLFDIAGQPTVAGNPDYAATHPVPDRNAWVVDALLAAGASVIGKAHTDELAFSLSGTNVHFGTPVNPHDPERVPGGSSSGSAVAVATGLVPYAIGTDTGGSIRIPASYCGIFGFRPSHGRLPMDGATPLAPRFDTVGVLAARGSMLETVGRTLLSAAAGESSITADSPWAGIVVADDVLALADPAAARSVGAGIDRAAAALGLPVRHGSLAPGRADDWRRMFIAGQLSGIWRTHGEWVTATEPGFGPGVAVRMSDAAAMAPERAALAELGRAEVLRAVDALLGPDDVLAFASASGVAPLIDTSAEEKGSLRMRTISMTCIAGLGGLPAVSVPLAEVDGLPVGVCFVGRPGDDERLLALAAGLEALVSAAP